MGNPIQEQWIGQWLPQLAVGVCLGIGGLFDYWAGNVSRAPQWLRRLGHEWAWRLLQQPRLKASRYLLGNPLFIARVLREKTHQRLGLLAPPCRGRGPMKMAEPSDGSARSGAGGTSHPD